MPQATVFHTGAKVSRVKLMAHSVYFPNAHLDSAIVIIQRERLTDLFPRNNGIYAASGAMLAESADMGSVLRGAGVTEIKFTDTADPTMIDSVMRRFAVDTPEHAKEMLLKRDKIDVDLNIAQVQMPFTWRDFYSGTRPEQKNVITGLISRIARSIDQGPRLQDDYQTLEFFLSHNFQEGQRQRLADALLNMHSANAGMFRTYMTRVPDHKRGQLSTTGVLQSMDASLQRAANPTYKNTEIARILYENISDSSGATLKRVALIIKAHTDARMQGILEELDKLSPELANSIKFYAGGLS